MSSIKTLGKPDPLLCNNGWIMRTSFISSHIRSLPFLGTKPWSQGINHLSPGTRLLTLWHRIWIMTTSTPALCQLSSNNRSQIPIFAAHILTYSMVEIRYHTSKQDIAHQAGIKLTFFPLEHWTTEMSHRRTAVAVMFLMESPTATRVTFTFSQQSRVLRV